MGVALLGLWFSAEYALATAQLSKSELQSIVGGIEGPPGCQIFTQEKHGYRCSNNRTMTCSLICSPCSAHSNNEVLCRLKQCWACKAGGTHDQLKECIVGTETQNCDTFGDQPENVVCGNEENKYCLYDMTEQRCYCDPPLFDSGLACARKDCADF